MKLWPFRILECVFLNIFTLLLYVFCYLPVGTPLDIAVARYVTVFGLINIVLMLRMWRFSNKPEPPVAINFPWGKFLKGNGIGLGMILWLLLERHDLEYVVFLVVFCLGFGNLFFVFEWDWRKSRLSRTEESPEK